MPSTPTSKKLIDSRHGAVLAFQPGDNGDWILRYQAAPAAMSSAETCIDEFSDPIYVLAEGDFSKDKVITYPINTIVGSVGYLQPKHGVLRKVVLEGFGLGAVDDLVSFGKKLRRLPSGFVTNPYDGLGLDVDPRALTGEAYGTGELHIQLKRSEETPAFRGPEGVLEDYIKSISRSRVGKESEKLAELSVKIEEVTLRGIVAELNKKIEQHCSEEDWTNFFKSNPFILKLAFGIPIMMFDDDISVGARTYIDLTSDQTKTFAIKAAASGNLSLIEVRSTEIPLVDPGVYRSRIHAPSAELAGAVNQILQRQYELHKSITVLREKNQETYVESCDIKGIIVAGVMPVSWPERRSFELFRNGLKSILVITFDELRNKLEHMLEVLRSPPEDPIDTGLSTPEVPTPTD
jgi:hypothetical protein